MVTGSAEAAGEPFLCPLPHIAALPCCFLPIATPSCLLLLPLVLQNTPVWLLPHLTAFGADLSLAKPGLCFATHSALLEVVYLAQLRLINLLDSLSYSLAAFPSSSVIEPVNPGILCERKHVSAHRTVACCLGSKTSLDMC